LLKRIPLGFQVLAGLIVGVVLALISKQLGINLKVLGDGFIRLIEMAIVPLVFPLIVLGVARMKSVRTLGRVAGKTILYFEVVTTLILVVAMILGNITQVGASHPLAGNANAIKGLAQGVDFKTFLLNIIPNNVFDALSKGSLLSIVFFALFLGMAMASVGDKAKPLESVLESLAEVMLKVINYVVRFAPLGVMGYVAYDIAKYGWSSIKLLGGFILVAYIGMLIILLVILPIVAVIFKIKYFQMIRFIWDLLLLAFVTRSSEVVLAPLMERLERYGADNSVTSFVVPLGYSFNLDGATLYEGIAVLFLSHVYGIHLGIGQQIAIIGTLMIMTKGLAGVPSAAVVVLIATAKATGLPLDAIALLLGVDFFIDMARTAVNVVGNSLATVVIAKSEKKFHPSGVVPSTHSAATP
jgi:proton glutamate symport protein